MLSILIIIPLLGLLLILCVPREKIAAFKWIALATSIIQLVVSAYLLFMYQAGTSSLDQYQFGQNIPWIDLALGEFGHLSIRYAVGVEGIGVVFVLLSVLILLIGVISSWNIAEKRKGYFALYQLLNASIIGCFIAQDFFLFFLFFEFMLLPMYFLIGIWGGKRRAYASIKFFLYTLLGSVFILVVMIMLYVSAVNPVETGIKAELIGSEQPTLNEIQLVQKQLQQNQIDPVHYVHTFEFRYLKDVKNYIPNSFLSLIGGGSLFGQSARMIAFLALFIGFAIKLPAVPVHTWLPDAHVEAPTPISVILAGLLLKIGAYGLLRVAYTIFPEGGIYYAEFIAILGLIAILYGAFNALAQQDLKKLVAYSSISHMGFVLLGLASITNEGLSGAIFQSISHGIISPLLFLLVGVIYDRTGSRQIDDYQGLIHQMPKYTTLMVIATFASLGLPGFSGFVGELFIFLGAFEGAAVEGYFMTWIPIVATIGLIIGAAYYLWMLQRVFMGPFSLKHDSWKLSLSDLSAREWLMVVPLAILTLLFGIFPSLLLDLFEPYSQAFIEHVRTFGAQHLKAI
jgi:NADH-quinone oxidoreductase subunit M